MNVKGHIDAYAAQLKENIDALDRGALEMFSLKLVDVLRRDATVYACGNGGSAATASHFISDLNKGVGHGLASKFRAICLSDNSATFIAYANDHGFEHAFEYQLRGSVRAGDMVIGISGSGNSPNILRSIEYAKSRNAFTVGWCGYGGGKLKGLVDLALVAPSTDMQICEDVHVVIAHLTAQILCRILHQDAGDSRP